MIWGPSPNGLFSVKGAYKTQMQEVNPHPNTQLLNVLWNYRLFPLRSNCLVGFFCVANCQSDKDLAGSFPILLLNVHSVGVNLNLLITCSCIAILLSQFGIIWDARNNLIHLDYWKANHKLKKQKQVVPPIKWKPPPSGWIKLNFDGSIKNGVANTSFFIQNDNAHTLLPGAKNIGVNSITMAECLALRDGLAHANLLHEQSKIHELLDNLEWEASHS
ncbi:hypothetical protein L3X38_002325 [Prunus dulcis]|uniref:RNase H type-1 domain-containing protein n=1 Tax=Prunus dulcis TaxID=3755 RepID=A0AAD4WU86_PRUDU|nr:hypothetical protein L3X38_002325 [Prunus dulcis]